MGKKGAHNAIKNISAISSSPIAPIGSASNALIDRIIISELSLIKDFFPNFDLTGTSTIIFIRLWDKVPMQDVSKRV
ncbi:hypothetical protein D3C81_1936960 [compost metagenome]